MYLTRRGSAGRCGAGHGAARPGPARLGKAILSKETDMKDLQRIMKERGHAPLDVALAVGVTERTVYRWIAGESEPRSRGVLARIREYMKK